MKGSKSDISRADDHIIKRAKQNIQAIEEINNEIDIYLQLKNKFEKCPALLGYKENEYIKISLITGIPLDTFIAHKMNDSKLKISKAAKSVSQLLIEFHELGYYHRDLMATNIILDEGLASAYIVDFGKTSANKGQISKDLAFLFSSMIKVEYQGGVLQNVLLFHRKCFFFMLILNYYCANFRGFHLKSYFFTVMRAFVLRERRYLAKKKLNIKYQLAIIISSILSILISITIYVIWQFVPKKK